MSNEKTPLTNQQWGICFLAALAFLFVGELYKLVLRLFRKESDA